MSPPPLGTDETTTMELENVYAAAGSSNSNNKKSNDKNKLSETTTRTTDSGVATDDAVLFSPQLLQMYYKRLFPFSFMYDWLSYNGGGAGGAAAASKTPASTAVFSRREFSFTIDVNGREIYIRYQSFANQKELEQAIIKRCPQKIDIGAVFSLPPKDKNSSSGAFQPVQRELVFDIDLTDYDEIRKCGCCGAQICPICWTFMEMAVCVMDQGLRQDFGWRHIAWFYSGRRGIHAWVCDASARQLTDQGRSAVAKYFEVDLGTDKNKEVRLTHPLHPMLRRSYEVLEPMFIKQVIPASGHGLLATEENWTTLLDSIPETAAKVRNNLKESWSKNNDRSTPEEKWQELKMHMQAFCKKTPTGVSSNNNNSTGGGGTNKQTKTLSSKDKGRLENWPAEVVFRYTYPRLDINVSKMRNHLLKSPFCVHPKTGRVCVPIQPEKMCDFDPFAVPTLPQLMKELDDYEAKNRSNDTKDDSTAAAMETDDSGNGNGDKQRVDKKDIPNWQKTSLKGYFEPFVKEFLEPLQKELRREARDEAELMAAACGDF